MKGRYRERHGREPPAGFLSDFVFYREDGASRPGCISVRRLRYLGEPRIPQHPAIAEGLLEKGGRFLDAGCGAGDGSRWLQENGYGEVTGIDLSSEAIRLGHAFYGDKESNRIFVVGDVLSMQPGPKSPLFDCVYSGSMIHTMHSIADVKCFVEASKRVLKRDGVFLGNTLGSDRHVEGFTPLQLTENKIKGIIEKDFRLEHFHVKYLPGDDGRFRAYYFAFPRH